MQTELRQTCRRLLEEGTVRVVIGYSEAASGGAVHPVFVTRPEDVDLLIWNDRCVANLVKYLLRKEVRALGKPAIVVKGCDARALVVLEKESQIDRSQIVAIGMTCAGQNQPKCEACDVATPRFTDVVIGQANSPERQRDSADGTHRLRDAALDSLRAKTPAKRMAFWKDELSRCVKCYACRQVCPMCYCERCIVDKNRPTVIDTSATLKGNFAWHITRAFHLAGRCVGCDRCTAVCPAGIDLRLLNLTLAQAAEEHFGYRPGMDLDAEPIVGAYSIQDREDFIR